MPARLLNPVDVAPVFIASGLKLLNGVYVSIALIDPFNGSVEAVAVISGYFETGVSFLVFVEEGGATILVVFAGSRKGPALVSGSGPRIAGFAYSEIGY